jgi:hypothetical protein
VIFLTGKFVSKHVIQLRVRNKDCSKLFSETFVIHHCSCSKNSLYFFFNNKRNDIVHLATRLHKETRFSSRSNLNLQIFLPS